MPPESSWCDSNLLQNSPSTENEFDNIQTVHASSYTPADDNQLCLFPSDFPFTQIDSWPELLPLQPEKSAIGDTDLPFTNGSWLDSPFYCTSNRFLSPVPSLCEEPIQNDDPAQSNESGRLACSKCDQRFDNVYSLDQHAKTSGHKTFKCPVIGCDRTYCRKDSWQRHKKTHDLMLTCNLCSGSSQKRIFKRRDHLRTHIRNCHPDVPLPPETTTPAACVQQERQQTSYSAMEKGPSSQSTFSDTDGARYESSAVKDLVLHMRKLLCDRDDVLRAVDEKLSLDPSSTTEQLAFSIARLVENSSRKGVTW